MNYRKYEILSNLPRIIFSFVASFIICFFILGSIFYMPYLLIAGNSLSPIYFVSSEMFLFFKSAAIIFLIQTSIYSIIHCCLYIWMLDDDYEKNKYIVSGESISKELFFKLKLLKHIPIFSVFNAFVYLLTGKTMLHRIYSIEYNFENENVFSEKVLRKYILIILFISFFQFIGSSYMYIVDDEIHMDKYLESIETIKDVKENILVDEANDKLIYNLTVYLQDGYIHYNKLTYAKEEIKKELAKNAEFIKGKYAMRIGEISGFNIIIYNEYTKTWDKYMYNQTFDELYPLENISDNISDIDIYIRENTLVYNILTNLSRDEIGWDMAEFILKEFEKDIIDSETNEKIKNILSDESDIKKYVINILSKEYYLSKNNSYFVYIKDVDDSDWFYYDNEFYSLEKREKDFEFIAKEQFKKISFDFKNLYETGEISIITKEDITLDDLYKLLETSYEGQKLSEQVKHIGNVSKIKFVVREDAS